MLKGTSLDLDLDCALRAVVDIVRNLALRVDNICILDLSCSLVDSLDCDCERDLLNLDLTSILFFDNTKFDFVFADAIDDLFVESDDFSDFTRVFVVKDDLCLI